MRIIIRITHGIYERYDWMHFGWDKDRISALVEKVSAKIGFLHGRIASLAEDDRSGASVEILTQDIVSSFRIEGISLNTDDVRSSIVRRLGVTHIHTAGTSTHFMEGVVDMMLDATRNCSTPLDRERLFGWHSALFPTGRSGAYPITVGAYRKGDVQVISGSLGHETVHFMAPPASDVNGRIGRAIADMALAAIGEGKGYPTWISMRSHPEICLPQTWFTNTWHTFRPCKY